jgi:beta-phosphoglucomutase-like phosphatase (HAD superfamily)
MQKSGVRAMEDPEVPNAAIFDLDGTLLDSVDLHALAWHEAMKKFGHDVSFEQARSQIGKGGDKLIPEFLSEDAQRDHGKELEEWRGQRFKAEYLPLVRPFSAVPDLLRRVRDAGLRVAIGSSAKKDELDKYLDIARIADLVDVKTSSEDAEESKPAPDIFEIVLEKLGMEGSDAVAIGDFPTMRKRRARRRSRRSACSAAGSLRISCAGPGASTYIPDPPPCSLDSRTRCSGGRTTYGEEAEDLPDVAGFLRAPSMKAALEAWGAESNLFHQGAAKESQDPDVIAATMAKPGVVLKRPVGSDGPFGEHAELPKNLAGMDGKSPPTSHQQR